MDPAGPSHYDDSRRYGVAILRRMTPGHYVKMLIADASRMPSNDDRAVNMCNSAWAHISGNYGPLGVRQIR
jgi:hypothetical protein